MTPARAINPATDALEDCQILEGFYGWQDGVKFTDRGLGVIYGANEVNGLRPVAPDTCQQCAHWQREAGEPPSSPGVRPGYRPCGRPKLDKSRREYRAPDDSCARFEALEDTL